MPQSLRPVGTPAPVAAPSGERTAHLSPEATTSRQRWGAMLATAIRSAGSSQQQVADALACSRARIAAYVAGEAGMRPEQTLALPPRVRHALGGLLAEDAERDQPRRERTHGEHVVQLVAELGDVARADDLDARERELLDVQRATAHALADLRRGRP